MAKIVQTSDGAIPDLTHGVCSRTTPKKGTQPSLPASEMAERDAISRMRDRLRRSLLDRSAITNSGVAPISG
jgi:hypothetical protein